jgi:hypothetical protein
MIRKCKRPVRQEQCGRLCRAILLGVSFLAAAGLLSSVTGQNTIVLDLTQRAQVLQSFDTYSEISMWHTVHLPDARDLVQNLNGQFRMCIKSNVETVNDNNDPYSMNTAAFTLNNDGKAGFAVAKYFPWLRECKRLSDSLVNLNHTRKPFSLSLMPGFYDRSSPDWLESTAHISPSLPAMDSTKYNEYAEMVAYLCKMYKDSTGLDVTSVNPLQFFDGGTARWLTNPPSADNLKALLDSIGTMCARYNLHPELELTQCVMHGNAAPDQYFLDVIHGVLSDPVARQYVKRIELATGANGVGYMMPSDAYSKQVADSAVKYGVDVTGLTWESMSSDTNFPGTWATVGLNYANVLVKLLTIGRASRLSTEFLTNFEIGGVPAALYADLAANSSNMNNPNDPKTALPEYYCIRQLFGDITPGATYVVKSSTVVSNVTYAVLHDTAAGNVVCYLVNSGTADASVTLQNPHFSQMIAMRRSSQTERSASLTVQAVASPITLKAQSLTSVVFKTDTSAGTRKVRSAIGIHAIKHLVANHAALAIPGQSLKAKRIATLTGRRLPNDAKKTAAQVLMVHEQPGN